MIISDTPNPLVPYYGLESLFLFPYYDTQENYTKLTGKPCPAYDDSKPPKHWEDLSEKTKNDPRKTITYALALQTSDGGPQHTIILPDPSNSHAPWLDILTVKKSEAMTVNIPPSNGLGVSADYTEVQVPLRPCKSYESLEFGLFNVIQVRDKRVNLSGASVGSGAGSEYQTRLLEAIAGKLGVPLPLPPQ